MKNIYDSPQSLITEYFTQHVKFDNKKFYQNLILKTSQIE